MAPHVKNSTKKQNAIKKTKFKSKEVRYRKKDIPIKKSEAAGKPDNYENLILYYLTKLKKLFATSHHPTSGVRENSGDKMRRESSNSRTRRTNIDINPNKYTARQSTPRPHDTDNDIRDKVYNVVNAAIEYGFKNNVIERKGNCFMLKNKKNPKLANRQPTPGPSPMYRSYYNNCNCSKCAITIPYKNHQPSRPSSVNQRYYTRSMSTQPGHLHESKTYHPLASASSKNNLLDRSSRTRSCTMTAFDSLKDRGKNNCNCTKCRDMEQKRKMYKK